MMAPALDLELGTILSNTYKITGKLGEGGMGSVYSADHQRLPRPYAIKVLHEVVEPESEFYHRFRREAEICSRLRHENIVEVVDFNFTPDGRPYIAMELLDGEDLETRLEREGRLSEIATLEIVRQISAGLMEAHEQGVIHRDLKPQNIFLCKRRQGGDRVKIVDFGISKIQGSVSVLTAAFSLVGTPYYMSPEQTGAGDGQVTARSDIYALGVIAYQMLSAEMPIVGDSLAKIVMSINTMRPRPLRELVPQLSPAVEAVIDVALAKEPLNRFASAGDFHEALRRAVEIGDLMGITVQDSVAATVSATGLPTPEGQAPVAELGQTTSYAQRGEASNTAQTPGIQGLGALGAAAAVAVQSGPSDDGGREARTIRERPAGAGVMAAQGPAAADVAAHRSSTTLSGAAGEAPQAVALPQQSSSRGPVLALAIVVLLALGAGGAWYALSGRGGTPSKDPKGGGAPAADAMGMDPEPPRARPMTAPATRVPVPGKARVVIRLKGLPPGATCQLDGKAVEGNPLVLPRLQKAAPLTCRAAGYKDGTVQLLADRDQSITLELTALPKSRSPARRPRARPMRRVMRPVMRRVMRPVMRRRARPIDSDIPIE